MLPSDPSMIVGMIADVILSFGAHRLLPQCRSLVC